MHSSLTRGVIRRIIRNQPILHRDYLPRRHILQIGLSQLQCRTMFDFLRRTDADRYADAIPGVNVMVNTSKKLFQGQRPPPPREVADAFNSYFNTRLEDNEPVLDNHAIYALKSLEYLNKTVNATSEPAITVQDAKTALLAMSSNDHQPGHGNFDQLDPAFVSLARQLHGIILTAELDVDPEAVSSYIRILSGSGYAEDAYGLLETSSRDHHNSDDWIAVLHGFQSESNRDGIVRTVELHSSRQQNSLPPSVRGTVAAAFLQVGDIVSAQKWLQHPSSEDGWMTVDAALEILSATLKYNHHELGKQVIQRAMKLKDFEKSSAWWYASLVWTAETGASAEQLDRMVEIMMQANPDMKADIGAINDMITLATSLNNPRDLEHLLDVAKQSGVGPEAITALYHMDSRLQAQDWDGALQAYDQLFQYDDQVDENQLLPRIDSLIRGLSENSPHDSSDSIKHLLAELEKHHARLEPATLASLAIYYLWKDQYTNVVRLLRSHLPFFSLSARTTICNALAGFCLQRRNPIGRVWDTFVITNALLPAEMSLAIRTNIMLEFLTRKRADMAVHVFGHMRYAHGIDVHPTAETYISLFQGAAKLKDAEALGLVHNMLKLDLKVDPDLKLWNALMYGYVECGNPERAFQFWDDLVVMQDLDRNSVLIVLRACEMVHTAGLKRSNEVWDMIPQMALQIDRDMVAAYVGALTGNGDIDGAKKVILDAEVEYQVKPDALILGMLYNALSTVESQNDIGQWIQENFLTIWTELNSIGVKRLRHGMKAFKVKIDIRP